MITGISGSGGTQPPQSIRSAEDAAGRQLVKDLQAHNLTAAAQDYATLSSFGANNSGPWTDPTMQAEFKQLGQDIQSGNLSGAAKDAVSLASGTLASDRAVAQQASNSGDAAAYQQAMANLQSDQAAIFGSEVSPSGSGNGFSAQA